MNCANYCRDMSYGPLSIGQSGVIGISFFVTDGGLGIVKG